MNENDIIEGIIEIVDNAIVLKSWKEFLSDIIIKGGVENGFKELKSFNETLYQEALEVGEALIIADKNKLVDQVADLAAQLFKMIFFKKK